MVRTGARAFTIIELLVVISIITLLVGILMPTIGKARDNALVNVSKNNLRQIGTALQAYGSDWADRQVTYVRDNLGQYNGNVGEYNAHIYPGAQDVLDGHPPIIFGGGYFGEEYLDPWPYWIEQDPHEPETGYKALLQPMHFPDTPYACGSCPGFGWFRFGIQAKPIHDYINGRWHDPVYYAPKDRVILDPLEPCFEVPGEFVTLPEVCKPGWGSYCLSPAALFAPQVLSDNDQGEYWTPPWKLPTGYKVPSFGQARYASLKTHVLEQSWLQNSKVACNVAFDSPTVEGGCEPYYFNHSFQSMPVTLFYDGSIRLMGVLEAMSSDRRIEQQSGHGLWSRDTSLGEAGYFVPEGYDFADTSFHILTIDGIRGRDTIGSE
jgi:type II secretory pathway pseudopilin PulG